MSFVVPWDETPLTNWYGRRRRGGPRAWNQLGDLWDEAMNEIGCLERNLEQATRGVTDTDFWPRGAIEHHIEGQEGAPGKYAMNIPLWPNIAPEDLKVSLKNNIMSIECKKESKSQDGNSRVYQEYSRKFTLPDNVDPASVKSVLHPDGYLKIEAPLPQAALKDQEPKHIPIEMK